MAEEKPVLCIGSVLWDVIGRCEMEMPLGADRPGRILRLPGGVALNIAMALKHFGTGIELLSTIGRDAAGEELLLRLREMGLGSAHVLRPVDLPTDIYMAVEARNGLIAAVADTHSLEAAGARILAPLRDGSLAGPTRTFDGIAAIDGNLTEDVLREIATGDLMRDADLRIAPASPGKAERLRVFLGHPGVSLYVNLEEAGRLLDRAFEDSASAATALCGAGLARAIVTNGGQETALASAAGCLVATPPVVQVKRVTGAGDTFMAAHITAEMRGKSDKEALEFALDAAARYVSKEESF